MPDFKLDYIEGKDGEEFQKSFSNMLDIFFYESIREALEMFRQGQLNGKISEDQGAKQQHIETVVLQMARLANEEIGDFLNEVDQETGKVTGDRIFGRVLRKMVNADLITYNDSDGTIQPNWEVEKEEDDSVDLDGVSYPVIDRMDPGTMIHYSENPGLFTAEFPKGNLEMIMTTARHLKEGVVTASSEEFAGNQIFMYELV